MTKNEKIEILELKEELRKTNTELYDIKKEFEQLNELVKMFVEKYLESN